MSMNFLKRVSVFLMFAFCLGVMVSCGEKTKKVSLTTDEIYTKAVEGIELPALQKISSEELSSLFKIKSSDVKESSVYISMINIRATEIGIFKYADKTQQEAIDKGIESRLKDLDSVWKTYLPDQYDLVKGVKKFNIGDVTGYVIAENASKIISNIEKALK